MWLLDLFGVKKVPKIERKLLIERMKKECVAVCKNCKYKKPVSNPELGYVATGYKCKLLEISIRNNDTCKYHEFSRNSIKEFNGELMKTRAGFKSSK